MLRSESLSRIRGSVSRLVLFVSLLFTLLFAPPAIALSSTSVIALLDSHQEAPGQVLYKSFRTVKDSHGRPWQAIAFNQTCADGRHNFQLRLVGFPGTAAIDRDRPLKLKTALGQTFVATDTSAQLFKVGTTAESNVAQNVAQYDLQSVVSHLPKLIPLRLTLPILDDDNIRFLIGPAVIQEWQSVALGASSTIWN